MNYTIIKNELLRIIKVFKEFRQILLGATIIIHIDHKNFTHEITQFTSQCLLCWCLLLEEFNPTFKHLQRSDNLIANALSCVLKETPLSVGETTVTYFSNYMGQVNDLLTMPKYDISVLNSCKVKDLQNPNITDCLLYSRAFDNWLGYCNFPTIEKYLNEDDELQNTFQTN